MPGRRESAPCGRESAEGQNASSMAEMSRRASTSGWRVRSRRETFPFPVKYGYCAVGIVEEGPEDLDGPDGVRAASAPGPLYRAHRHADARSGQHSGKARGVGGQHGDRSQRAVGCRLRPGGSGGRGGRRHHRAPRGASGGAAARHRRHPRRCRSGSAGGRASLGHPVRSAAGRPHRGRSRLSHQRIGGRPRPFALLRRASKRRSSK